MRCSPWWDPCTYSTLDPLNFSPHNKWIRYSLLCPGIPWAPWNPRRQQRWDGAGCLHPHGPLHPPPLPAKQGWLRASSSPAPLSSLLPFLPFPSLPASTTAWLLLIPTQKPSQTTASITYGPCGWELGSGPQQPHTPSRHHSSPVLSSHFPDGGTKVLREEGGSQGHRQGQQCQDSNLDLDPRSLNLRVWQLLT